MKQWLKMLGLAILFKDVTTEVEKVKGQGSKRPVWLHRTVIASALLFIGGVFTHFSGLKIEPDMMNVITDNVEKAANAVWIIYSTVLLLWGVWRKVRPSKPLIDEITNK